MLGTRRVLFCLASTLLLSLPLCAQDGERARILAAADELTAPIAQETDAFTLRVTAKAPNGETAEIALQRHDGESFALRVRSKWCTFDLVRNKERTVLGLPSGKVFVGDGELEQGEESLAPDDIVARLLGSRAQAPGVARAALLLRLATCPASDDGTALDVTDDLTIRHAPGDAPALELVSRARGGIAGMERFELGRADQAIRIPAAEKGMRHLLARSELERTILRALRRLIEIWALAPDDRLEARRVDGGELRIQDGQRVCVLDGDPARMGKAHGELLAPLVQRTVDSCLYLVGFIETVRTEKWFMDELDAAWWRLVPFIPDRHVLEIDAIADAVPGLSNRELRLANVFPEYFHCSGFAVFGSATKGGILYHGRALDYMTMIGLQQAAVTFIVRPDKGFAFLNVGYAGFTGSVTGMNERSVSFGEMGGEGRGEWDGVPMATLMRRGLEECATLEQAIELFQKGPRTCEYYYVIADGKAKRAVGMYATPKALELVAPGADHPKLLPGIPDTVILSADDRLKTLHERIAKQHGAIDREAAMHLLDRPVSMRSNLHNALMVPELGEAWIANATQNEPAADRPYVRHDLKALLADLAPAPVRKFGVRDSLRPAEDGSPDARAMLDGLCWAPQEFEVVVRARGEGEDVPYAAVVTFPSPRPSGEPKTDEVVLEWYPARGRDVPANAPAVLVLDILDGRMRVARGFATAFQNNGVHAFAMYLPHYGPRKSAADRNDPRIWLTAMRQGIADARRARDVIAALPGVLPDQVSIEGTSLGGFVAASAAALDGAFADAFLALAGGDLRTLFENGQRDIAKLRDRITRAGLDVEETAKMLDAVDPVRLAHRVDPSRVWMYSAREDQVVPEQNARALATAARLDDEHHVWFDGDHYTAALHLPDVFAHMLARVKPRAGASPAGD